MIELKYLQPSQYESWLRKADDPDWYEHRYRDAKDRALVSFARELRDCIATLDRALAHRQMLLDQVRSEPTTTGKYGSDHPVDALAQPLCDTGATMSAAYRHVAIDAYVDSVNANNAAQAWRNRAIAAEQEISEGGRGIDLRRGFEQ